MEGFAAEVAAMQAGKGEATPAPAPQTDGSEVMNNVIEPAKEEATPTPEVVSEPPKPSISGKVKIGAQEFDNVEDAIKYAQDLELAVLQQDAFQAGQKAALQTKEPTVEEKKVDSLKKKIAEKLFENPEEALEEYEKAIVEKTITTITEKQHREENIRKTWEDFYSKNQDLVGAKELVDYVMQKNWNEIGYLPIEKSLPLLAEKTRSLMGSMKAQQLPSKELPSAPAITATATGGATATAPKQAPTALDFISQLNKHRKRKS